MTKIMAEDVARKKARARAAADSRQLAFLAGIVTYLAGENLVLRSQAAVQDRPHMQPANSIIMSVCERKMR